MKQTNYNKPLRLGEGVFLWAEKVWTSSISIEAYIKLVQRYGGTNIYIAKIDKIKNLKRDSEIYKQFNGFNYKYLANKYKLAERTVREIITRESGRSGATQLSFFDDS